MGLGGGVVLVLGGVRLVGDDGDEEDAGTGKEAGAVKGLEDRVVAAFDGIGVEKELRGGVPEYFVLGKLKKNLSVGGCRYFSQSNKSSG